jgi:hypothetical protein
MRTTKEQRPKINEKNQRTKRTKRTKIKAQDNADQDQRPKTTTDQEKSR